MPGLEMLQGGFSGDFGPPAEPIPQMAEAGEEFRRRDTLRRLLKRHMEGLRLYRPLPHLEPFHAANCKWRIIDGSNRSSKSQSGACEVSRAWCGCDPYDKYIRRNGNSLVVGLRLQHIEMLWRKCAQPGSFKIIRDEHSGLYRSVRPDPNDSLHLDPYDQANKEKWKDAPPLIPPRMIAKIAWEDRGKGIPAFVQFKTGWRALFCSSDSKPPQGDHYHLVLFDEELVNQGFINEAIRGLVALDEIPKHCPKGIWTATAQTANPELLEFREQSDGGSESIRAFQALIADNPYVSDEEKQAFHDVLSEDDRDVRYYGKYALAGRRCYPTYDPQGIHGYEPKEIPPHWCRYIGVDPGTQHCGTIFVAVDPKEEHVWLYDGFDLRQADATAWARRIKARGEQYEAIVLDERMGKQRFVGHHQGQTVASQYRIALDAVGVKPRQAGPLEGFFPGTHDVPGRQEALRNWMVMRHDSPHAGSPRLKVARGILPVLDQQIRHAHMDMRNAEKRAKMDHDLLEALEYLAGFDPCYYEPRREVEEERDIVWERFQAQERRTRRPRAPNRLTSALEMG